MCTQEVPLRKEFICAVIVTFRPDNEFNRRFKHITQQVDRVVIVDNGSSDSCINMLQDICIEQNAHLIVNSNNLGIAIALNQGIRFIGDLGYKWVLTMDDDSSPKHDMINKMIIAYDHYPNKEKIGIIGANPRDTNIGKSSSYEKKCINNFWIEEPVVNTSGSLMPLEVFYKIGPYKDEYFIDCVDQEYCLRLRANNYRVIVACHAELIHSIGHQEKAYIFKKEFIPTHHNHLRYYYRARNSLLLGRDYLF
ncbi:MAG: glycosyltransferase family 2 protein, partial [Bacteroidetes bacterium]|nr:glycosyltransferase family 2 protein [Bacteroidota bacterium]